MIEFKIEANDAGQRVDRFLRKYLSGASLGSIQKLIRKKNIRINGKHVQGNYVLQLDDTINLYISDQTLKKWIKDDRTFHRKHDLDIIYEDENIILLNKPTGILIHPASPKDYGKTLVDQMIAYLIDTGAYHPRNEKTFVPAMVNRLDRNTGGLVIGAKNAQTLALLNKALREFKIDKYYRAIVVGEIKEPQLITSYLEKDENKNKVELNSQNNKGKKILTGLIPLRNSQELTDLRVHLITGRTHQIRAHLSYIGHPILGDIKYGDPLWNKRCKDKFQIKHQLLFSESITFDKIRGMDYLEGKSFSAPLPEIYKNIMEYSF